ncbi:putative N-acyltransferase [Phyllobacterium myrsinacearum]|uniref:Putative N-acyltransferase n=2 Tax=Phyllobacterium myrsinacearum TaxID=28101 RepID=A0A839EQS4_9HYPH|nr:GNAT family N-acetyltransferase [Phyllobacterium myrsinacearum]MBA8881269.1 putative N-acyltransferase [Phyllobacterium myrsinacearum]
MLQPMHDHVVQHVAASSKIAVIAQARVFESIRAIGRDAWNKCFPDEVEDYDCLLAIEEAGISGFAFRYVTVMENGQLLAAMPAFLTDYQLDTTLEEGRLRQILRHVRRAFPRFLTLKLACLGSPCTENGVAGFHPNVLERRKADLFSQLLRGFEHYAKTNDCSLIGIKDVPEPATQTYGGVFADHAFAGIPGLPTAWLNIDFDAIDTYMARLSSGTRKDMRRKMKSFDKIRVEKRTDFGTMLPEVMALYHDTRNRSEWQFEELTSDYFAGILRQMQGRSFCTFYYADDQLLAANLLVHDGNTLIDKFFCMNSAEGRAYNLYYLSWFTNLRHCLDHGIKRYQSGQAYYENKIRLGSQLTRNTMYFKHRNPVIQWALRLASPLFAADETLRDGA